jgi:hypothetical protein
MSRRACSFDVRSLYQFSTVLPASLSEFQKERPIPTVHQPDDEWQDSKKPETMKDVGPISIVKSEEEGV